MTKEMLDHLRRVLDPGSTPAPKDQTNVARGQWRSQRVHIRSEISLGTVLRRDEYFGPTDSRY